MRTIQMTIDEPLLEEVDRVIRDLGTTRSSFIRSALQLALRQHAISRLERQHAEGYARQPLKPGEIEIWEPEQEWGDPCIKAMYAGALSMNPTNADPCSS